MSTLPATDRTRIRRLPARGNFDREAVYSILDEALVCHLGIVHHGAPVVIPTACWRVGDHLYFHGAPASRTLKVAGGDAEVCITVTLLDGLVLARSAFHHSLNYRSVVIFGRPEVVPEAEKEAALDAFVEHVMPGRLAGVRPPSEKELRGTQVLRLAIEEASAKVRVGGPVDDEEDYALPHWAGVLPLALTPGAPVPDPRLPQGALVPEAVTAWRRG